MVRIRLRRMGKRHEAHYRVVVADQRSPRDGRFIEVIGQYNPRTEPSTINIDSEKALAWLRKGAQPTDQVRALLKRLGIWSEFVKDRGPAPKRPKKRKASPPPPTAKKAEAPAAPAAAEPSADEAPADAESQAEPAADAAASEDA